MQTGFMGGMEMRKQCVILFLFLYLAFLGGCGSGSRGSGIVPPPPPVSSPPPPVPSTQPVTVTVLPATVTLAAGATQQFTTVVTGTGNTAVTWQVAGVTGGDSVHGTISSNGLYTAPDILPVSTQIGVTAISTADTSASGHATLQLSRGNSFIYVSSGSDDNIQIFSVKSTGIPLPISTLSVGAGKNPVALAMHPTGKFLYSLNRGSNDISIFAIDADTGDLAPSGAIATPNGPYAMVFSPTGTFAYVSCDNAAAVAAFSLDGNTGALSPVNGSPYALGGTPQGLATSPGGKFLYVTDSSRNQIIGLAISPSDASLSEIAGSPFAAGAGVASIVTTSGGDTDWAYAANRDNGTVRTYTLDKSSGSLDFYSDVSSGGDSPELFSSGATGFLLGVNSGSDNFFSYELDGELYAYGPPVNTGALPRPGGVLQNDSYYPWAYVVNSATQTSAASISVYYVYYDGVSEAPIASVPTASTNPTGFAITP